MLSNISKVQQRKSKKKLKTVRFSRSPLSRRSGAQIGSNFRLRKGRRDRKKDYNTDSSCSSTTSNFDSEADEEYLRETENRSYCCDYESRQSSLPICESDNAYTGQFTDTDNDSEYSVDLELIEFMSNRPTVDMKHSNSPPGIFDLYEYLNDKGLGSDALCSPQNSIWKTIDVPINENRIKVSKRLQMTRSGSQFDTLKWCGTIVITNQTALNMLYEVYSLHAHINSQIHWIGPKGIRTVQVHVSDWNIKNFFNHGQILVKAKPIYHKFLLERYEIVKSCREQIDSGPFKLLFCNLEDYSTECHEINDISSNEYNSMDNWSILDTLYAGQRIVFGPWENTRQTNFRVPNFIRNPGTHEIDEYIRNYEVERTAVQQLMRMRQSEHKFSSRSRYTLLFATITLTIGILYFMNGLTYIKKYYDY